MMNDIIANIINIVITIIGSIVTAVLLPAAASWLKSKTESQRLQSVIDDITVTVQTSVAMLEQTVVKQLKADGTWNAQSQSKVLQQAVDEVIDNLTSTTYNYIVEESDDIEGIVTRYIEAYIQSMKTDK